MTKTKKGSRLILLVPFGPIEIGIDITDIESLDKYKKERGDTKPTI